MRTVLIFFISLYIMRAYDIILKKRNGQELTAQEISYMVQNYTKGLIPDYQFSAFLMAIWFQKMSSEERSHLTMEIVRSGRRLDFSFLPGKKVDKHSTGGVGDGTSLIIVPIVAAADGLVPMMAGRGLGHTGGTIDKLESIPGFKVNLDEERIKKNLEKIGAVIICQTDDITPADKKIYALRDVTATVDSIDLISASIMSKKIAEDIDSLVLDIKTGSGAFMTERTDAIDLGKAMIEIGKQAGKDIFAYITDMNQPLGRAVGNSLEIIQAIEVLKGNGPADIINLSNLLSARMLVMAGLAKDITEGKILAEKMIDSGKALNKMKEIIENQNGDSRVLEDYSLFPQANIKKDFLSPKKGYIQHINTKKIGLSGVILGVGREKLDSKIDQSAGYILYKKIGDAVDRNEPLLTVYGNDENKIEKAMSILREAFIIGNKISDPEPLVYGFVTDKGYTENVISKT